jgi:hypothetical protein
MTDENQQGTQGAVTRLKKRQRGFHFETEPGFFDVKGTFDRAAPSKTAADNALRGYVRVLRKYALLNEQQDPIDFLSRFFASKNFGYGRDKSPDNRSRGDSDEVIWGTPSGMPSETGDARGASRFLQFGGV